MSPWLGRVSCFAAAFILARAAEVRAEVTGARIYKIVYVGDSVTAGYGVQPQQAYPFVVEQKLKERGWRIQTQNASISGSLASSAPSRMRWVAKTNPDIVVLALGGNDGLKGTPVSDIQRSLKEALETAKTHKADVILGGFEMFRNMGETYTQDFSKMYKNLGRMDGVIFIPFLLEGVGARPEMNLPDGKHPNILGHKRIAENVIPAMEKALNARARSQKP